ncbi:hypothetical protein HZ326_6255 [Fusarium oxysporum f. sp. albedinis]|nr:hypothetical protein HZ326_6255 [Fusarium oxysporum f. sp. albedinis]
MPLSTVIEATQDLIRVRHGLLICYCSTLVRRSLTITLKPKVQRSFPWPKGKSSTPRKSLCSRVISTLETL